MQYPTPMTDCVRVDLTSHGCTRDLTSHGCTPDRYTNIIYTHTVAIALPSDFIQYSLRDPPFENFFYKLGG